jgi:UDP-N-acetylglucosamine:LPS N-acetylglucosamine transferase
VTRQRLEILLVSSSGGVLVDLLALKPWWSRHNARWVAVRATDTESELAGMPVRWAAEHDASRPLAVLPALVRARRHLRETKPDVLVSAGTGVAVPYFLAARQLGIPSLWIETFNMVGSAGYAARICSRLAERVIVQRPELVPRRRRAVLIGELY